MPQACCSSASMSQQDVAISCVLPQNVVGIAASICSSALPGDMPGVHCLVAAYPAVLMSLLDTCRCWRALQHTCMQSGSPSSIWKLAEPESMHLQHAQACESTSTHAQQAPKMHWLANVKGCKASVHHPNRVAS